MCWAAEKSIYHLCIDPLYLIHDYCLRNSLLWHVLLHFIFCSQLGGCWLGPLGKRGTPYDDCMLYGKKDIEEFRKAKFPHMAAVIKD